MFIAVPMSVAVASPAIQFHPPVGPVVVLAINWRERRIPLARGGNIRGFYPQGPGRAPIEFESLLERDVIDALLHADARCNIVSQPLTIHYRIGGEVYKYTPDFLVEFSCVPDELASRGFQRLSLIECKPRSKVDDSAEALARAYAALREVTSTPLLLVYDAALSVVPWGEYYAD